VSYLAENAAAIWIGGAVLVTLAVIVYVQVRSTAAFVGIFAAVLLTIALVVAERLIVTPREAVGQTLNDLAATIEADDLPGVLQFIAPTAAEVRADAEALMPLVVVDRARIISTPEIVVDESTDPPTATVNCQGLVDVTVKQNGMQGPYMDRVEIQFVRSGDRWLIESYTPSKDWHREATRGRN
jgi:hypothetical protein